MIEWSDNLKKYSESVILFMKVFIVLLIFSFILPNILAFILNYIIIKPEKPPENYLFVFNHPKKANPFMKYFMNFWEK